jgi:hypothetical protein
MRLFREHPSSPILLHGDVRTNVDESPAGKMLRTAEEVRRMGFSFPFLLVTSSRAALARQVRHMSRARAQRATMTSAALLFPPAAKTFSAVPPCVGTVLKLLVIDWTLPLRAVKQKAFPFWYSEWTPRCGGGDDDLRGEAAANLPRPPFDHF